MKKKGSEYTSTIFHHPVAGPMCHLREADVKIDFFQDEEQQLAITTELIVSLLMHTSMYNKIYKSFLIN